MLGLDDAGVKDLAVKATEACAAALGKREASVQALVTAGVALLHGGTDEPAATVELKSLGLQEDACPALSKAICEFLEAELGIPGTRVYIEFVSPARAMFGWNGGTFG